MLAVLCLLGMLSAAVMAAKLLPMFDQTQTPTVPSHVGDGFICSFLSGEGIILLAVSEKGMTVNAVQNYTIGIKYIT